MSGERDIRQQINIEMGEQREQIRRLNDELRETEQRLISARHNKARTTEELAEIAAEAERQRLERFGHKLKLEARRRLKLKIALPPGVTSEVNAPPQAFDFHVKRQAVRAPYFMPVNFGGLRDFYSGLAINVSLGGLMVATCDPPPLAHRFVVEFDLDFEEFPIRAPVESVWLQQESEPDLSGSMLHAMGVRFVGLTSWDNDRLTKFCESYAEAVGNF